MEEIKYKVKKQKPTTRHIALNEKCLANWNELEAKAEAFDILKEKYGNRFYINDNNQLICMNFGYDSDKKVLTKEQCEILKKAGLE